MVFIYQSLKNFFDQVRELISPDVLCMVEQGPNYTLDILNKPVYIAVVVLGVFTTTTKPWSYARSLNKLIRVSHMYFFHLQFYLKSYARSLNWCPFLLLLLMLFLVFLYPFSFPQLVTGASVALLWTKDPFIIVWLNFTPVVNPSQPSFSSLGLAVNKIYDIDPYLANRIIKKNVASKFLSLILFYCVGLQSSFPSYWV